MSLELDVCLNATFHVCGLWDPLLNPIYDGGAARAADSCQWSNCGENIDVGFQFVIFF